MKQKLEWVYQFNTKTGASCKVALLTADDVAAMDLDTGMTIAGGRTVYERAQFSRSGMVRLERLQCGQNQRFRQINRYIDPGTALSVELNDAAIKRLEMDYELIPAK